MLDLGASSTIDLGTGPHTIRFINLNPGAIGTLSILDWAGTPNSAGTAGRIEFDNLGNDPNTDFAAFLSIAFFVLFFLVVATGDGEPIEEAGRLALEAGIGAGIGIALALVAGRLLDRLPVAGIAPKYEGAYALAVALTSFGLAEASGWGNGLIAAFVAGIALAVSRHDIPDAFAEFNESLSSIFQIVVFVVFGALVVATGWNGDVLHLAAFVAFALLVARPASVLLSLTGVAEPRANKLFIAWFGPKGVASILFALLVLASTDASRSLIFDVASFTAGLHDAIASATGHSLPLDTPPTSAEVLR